MWGYDTFSWWTLSKFVWQLGRFESSSLCTKGPLIQCVITKFRQSRASVWSFQTTQILRQINGQTLSSLTYTYLYDIELLGIDKVLLKLCLGKCCLSKERKNSQVFWGQKGGGKNKEYLVQPVARLFQFYGRITIRLYQCRSSNWRDQHRERKGALLSIAWLMVYPGSAAVQWCLANCVPRERCCPMVLGQIWAFIFFY